MTTTTDQRITRVEAELLDEKVELTALDTMREFNVWREGIQTRAFIITPVAQVDSIASIYQISRRIVRIDARVPELNASGAEVYHSNLFHGTSELRKGVPRKVSLGKTALMKLLAAAGGDVVGSLRMDDRKDPHFAEFAVTTALIDFDGVKRQFIGTKAVDLRNGSPLSKTMTEKNLEAARRAIDRLAEQKALQASIRGLLQLQQWYWTEDLMTKPFVIPKLVLRADHPAVQGRMIDRALGIEKQLYGSRIDEEAREIRQVEGARTTPALPAAETATPTGSRVPSEPLDDFGDLEIPDGDPHVILCLCPCGDQTEITEEIAKVTTEKMGAARCAACYPGPRFDVKRHEDVRDLKLPKRPDLTVEKIAASLKAGAK